MRKLATLALLLAFQTGCILVLNGDDKGDDDDDVCSDGWGDTPAPSTTVRNPWSGQCEYQGGGGGGGGGCAQPDGSGRDAINGGAAPNLDWATCDGFCESLDQNSCLLADGCRGAYVESCPECDDISPPLFAGCWGTAPSGPIRGGGCYDLDAQECSRHDDCVAVHRGSDNCGPTGFCVPTVADFYMCAPEPDVIPPGACTSDEQCGPGLECTAKDECLPQPGCDPGSGMGCDQVCYGKCVPVPVKTCGELDEPGCIGRSDCRPLYEGSSCTCGPNGCSCQDQSFIGCADGMTTGEGWKCGPYLCSDKEYCEHAVGGAPPPPGGMPFESYACKALPEQCAWKATPVPIPPPIGCGCLQSLSVPCADTCESDPADSRHATVTCNLP